MTIALVGISQETNTFNPITATIDEFREQTFIFGEELLRIPPGRETLNGVLDFFADKKEVELLPLMWAKAVANGKLSAEGAEYFKDELIRQLSSVTPFDGLLFSLHGAHVAHGIDDFTGLLLKTARDTVGEKTVIAVPMDHHAIITETVVQNSDIIEGHETQPHDLYGTGFKASRSLYRLLTEGTRPVKCFAKIPMIAPQDQFLTSRNPMKQWFDHARAFEKKPGVFSVSPFPLQPWVDVEEGGWAVTVYTDKDADLAGDIAAELSREAWSLREKFWVSERLTIEEGIRKAVDEPEGLVVISDTGDAVYGGGTGDSTVLLKEMVKQQIPCNAYLPIVDSEGIKKIFDSGLGKIAITLGGKYDPFSTPAEHQGEIIALSGGVTTATARGVVNTGRTALLKTGNIYLVVMEERNHSINMPIIYTHLGLSMEDAKIVVCKTGSNFQYFDPWRKSLVRIDTPGASQSDLTKLEWKSITRPVFPLDNLKDWSPNPKIVT